MKKEMMIFTNDEFGNIRTLTIGGEPWFVGKDITDILKYRNGSRDINRHIDEDDRQKMMIFDGNQMKETTVINESGMYALVLGSKLPTAKKFKRWVTSEVLPAIRKHGAYMTDEKAYDVTHNAAGLADLLQQAAEQLREKDVEIERMKPKELFADSVAASRTTILIGELAKIMRGNGINIGQNRLFAWMREHGYLINRKGSDWNMPTQKAMDLGLFRVKETTINHADGSTTIAKTVKVTGKGQQYFINRFIKGDCNG